MRCLPTEAKEQVPIARCEGRNPEFSSVEALLFPPTRTSGGFPLPFSDAELPYPAHPAESFS
jgi:hypothetical protein